MHVAISVCMCERLPPAAVPACQLSSITNIGMKLWIRNIDVVEIDSQALQTRFVSSISGQCIAACSVTVFAASSASPVVHDMLSIQPGLLSFVLFL